MLVNVIKPTCQFLLTISVSLLLIQCTVTTTKRKDPVFNADTKSIFYNITGVVRASEINVTGVETTTNGKIVSELTISLLNPEQLPADTNEIDHISREIATIVKDALKNADSFDSYKVLFVHRNVDRAVTGSRSLGRIYKYDSIKNYAYTVTLGDRFDSSVSRAVGKSTFNQDDAQIVSILSYYDLDADIEGKVKMFKETDTGLLLLTTRDLGKLTPGHNYFGMNWKIADFYKLVGLNEGNYRLDYFIRDTLVGSRTFRLL